MALPVVIVVEHEEVNSAGRLETYMQDRHIPYMIYRMWHPSTVAPLPSSTTDVVYGVPSTTEPLESITPATEGQEYRIVAVANLGGSMSANDNLPYYENLYSLIRSCAEHRTPYIGVCLGAQMLSKALGGTVGPSPNVEMGWLPLKVLPDTTGEVKKWFGDRSTIDGFMIHGESFSVPAGFHLVVFGDYCANQAIQYKDQYMFGTQFHPEVTTPRGRAMLEMNEKCLFWQKEIDAMSPEERAAKLSPAAMTRDAIEADLNAGRLQRDYEVTKQLYDTWCEGFLGH